MGGGFAGVAAPRNIAQVEGRRLRARRLSKQNENAFDTWRTLSREWTRVRFTAAPIMVLRALPIVLITRRKSEGADSASPRKSLGIQADRQRPAIRSGRSLLGRKGCAVRINNLLARVWGQNLDSERKFR